MATGFVLPAREKHITVAPYGDVAADDDDDDDDAAADDDAGADDGGGDDDDDGDADGVYGC